MGWYRNNDDEIRISAIIRDAIIGVVVLVLLLMLLLPIYNVWQAEKSGEAALRKAEQDRHILVLEAEAKRDSAKALAEAEIERAKGVAEANKIIADGLHGHDEYLRYLWIDKVAGNTQREIIYVPTEANIPILESTRLRAPTGTEK